MNAGAEIVVATGLWSQGDIDYMVAECRIQRIASECDMDNPKDDIGFCRSGATYCVVELQTSI